MTLRSAFEGYDDPSGGRSPARNPQLDAPQASEKAHNSIHNRDDMRCGGGGPLTYERLERGAPEAAANRRPVVSELTDVERLVTQRRVCYELHTNQHTTSHTCSVTHLQSLRTTFTCCP